MSHHKYEGINQYLVLRSDKHPSNYCHKFGWISKLNSKRNKNMEMKFSNCCLVCVDKSMIVFLNPHVPRWASIKKKKKTSCG